jgi:hypothetical protein
MSNFKVSQLPASTELVVEDILPVVDVSQMLTKKAEVGDLIDLAANTIESMPNLIVDPENNFTDFGESVRSYVDAGVTSITTGGTFPNNLSFSPSSGSVTASFNPEPRLLTLRVTPTSGVANAFAVGIENNLPIPTLAVVAAQNSDPLVPAAIIANAGIGPSFIVEDTLPTDTSRFIINNGGSVGIGVDTNPLAKLEIIQPASALLPAVRIINSGIANSLEILDNGDSDTTNFFVDAAGNVGIGLSGTPGSATAKLDVSQATGISQPAARITNLGTGNSLEVLHTADIEDGKFLIDNEGRTGIGMAGSMSAKLQVSHFGVEPSMKINDTFVIDTAGNLAIGSNTVDVDLSKIILGVNGSSMFNGAHANKAILRLTAGNTNISNHNFIYASGSLSVTGTLPDIFSVPNGTEYTFRKFSDATMLIRPFSSQLMEFVAGGTIPLTATGNVFIKIKSIEQSPIGKTWIIIQLDSLGGTFGVAVPP